MQQAFVTPGARDAIARHLTGLGLPTMSREGLLVSIEQGVAAGEADAVELRDRLLTQATASLITGIGTVADEIADVVIAPLETLGGLA